jgi:hypothetical protein
MAGEGYYDYMRQKYEALEAEKTGDCVHERNYRPGELRLNSGFGPPRNIRV